MNNSEPRTPNPEPNILALVPAYNEEAVVVDTVKALNSLPDVSKVVVADDFSTDNTVKKAEEAGCQVIRHNKNIGKGDSLNTAIGQLDIDSYEAILLADSDLGKSAIEFSALIEEFKKGKYQMVIAGFGAPSKKGGFGLVKGLSRWAISRYGGEFMQTPLSGQRLISVGALKDILPFAKGFGLETDMTIKALKKGYKVKEIRTKMSHNETGRDLAGFTHRGRQFLDVLKVVVKNMVNRRPSTVDR